MAKREPTSVYEVPFTERDLEIRRLEFQRSDVEEDLEEAIREFIAITKKRKLKKRTKKVPSVLRDATKQDKL